MGGKILAHEKKGGKEKRALGRNLLFPPSWENMLPTRWGGRSPPFLGPP